MRPPASSPEKPISNLIRDEVLKKTKVISKPAKKETSPKQLSSLKVTRKHFNEAQTEIYLPKDKIFGN